VLSGGARKSAVFSFKRWALRWWNRLGDLDVHIVASLGNMSVAEILSDSVEGELGANDTGGLKEDQAGSIDSEQRTYSSGSVTSSFSSSYEPNSSCI
jgi:hypothetical protein